MQDDIARHARRAIDHLRINHPDLWGKLKDPVRRTTNMKYEEDLKLYYKQNFPSLSQCELNTIASDARNAARAELILQKHDDLSLLIIYASKLMKSSYSELWNAMLLREAERREELDREYLAQFKNFLSYIDDSIFSFQTRNISVGVRIIAHAVALKLLDTEEF